MTQATDDDKAFDDYLRTISRITNLIRVYRTPRIRLRGFEAVTEEQMQWAIDTVLKARTKMNEQNKNNEENVTPNIHCLSDLLNLHKVRFSQRVQGVDSNHPLYDISVLPPKMGGPYSDRTSIYDPMKQRREMEKAFEDQINNDGLLPINGLEKVMQETNMDNFVRQVKEASNKIVEKGNKRLKLIEDFKQRVMIQVVATISNWAEQGIIDIDKPHSETSMIFDVSREDVAGMGLNINNVKTIISELNTMFVARQRKQFMPFLFSFELNTAVNEKGMMTLTFIITAANLNKPTSVKRTS